MTRKKLIIFIIIPLIFVSVGAVFLLSGTRHPFSALRPKKCLKIIVR
jgi:uncharacterized membrane protein